MKVFSRSSRYRIYDSVYKGNSFKYYFDIHDSIPIYCQNIVEDDGEIQYEDYTLQSYKFNNFDSASFFKLIADSLASLSGRCKLESIDSVIAHRPKITKNDTIAPDFRYVSFAGDSVELSTVLKKNKLVLLDFWYLSCGPCRDAIPKLVSIYKKYHNLGLEILGVDPFDTNRLSIENTIKKLGINYPIALADTSVAQKYKVQGYPTLFLIDPNKKILFYAGGYSEDLETRLSKVVEKHLR
jgi:thiol-disulfide isomerase/thioredoxin